MEQTVDFGLLTLVPPLVIIVFALITRRTFEALIVGVFIAFFMTDKLNLMSPVIDAIVFVIGDNAWVLITLGLFGSFIALVEKSKGTYGFGEAVAKYAKGPKKTLLITWVLGIVIFMDDYLNIMTQGAAMKPVSDKTKTPREMLAYVIDSTGAPACVIIPLSTWAIFFAGVFSKQPEIQALAVNSKLTPGMELYYQAIPFMFYAWAAVFLVPLVILGVVPKLFGMKKAYERVEATGRIFSERSQKFNNFNVSEVEQSEAGGKVRNFLLPMFVLVLIAIITGDLLIGLILALTLQLIMYLVTKTMTFEEFSDLFASGLAKMIPMLLICIAAFTVKIAMDNIGLPLYIINGVLPFMTAGTFPLITFIVVAGLSFITGSNWGIPAVTVPIIVPLAALSGASIPMTLGAIVSGGTFGSHACFYSDATVLTSQACGIDNLEHAFTQIPYAVIGALIAAIMYFIFGMLM